MSIFIPVTDDRLQANILSAQKRLVFIAPGVSASVAKALAAVMTRSSRPHMVIVLDVNADVYHLGFGDPEGLAILTKCANAKGVIIAQQEGIRTGILISDETTLIFSPTALCVEENSKAAPKMNGIDLPGGNLKKLESACDASAEGSDAVKREIGLDPVQPKQLEKVQKQLQENPPVPVDIQRKRRVWSTKFEYVDLDVHGINISKKKIKIPASFFAFTCHDPGLEESIKHEMALFDETNVPVTDKILSELKRLEKYTRRGMTHIDDKTVLNIRKKLVDDFCIQVQKYGTILEVKQKKEFDEHVDALEKVVMWYSDAIKSQIDERIDRLVARLTDAVDPGASGIEDELRCARERVKKEVFPDGTVKIQEGDVFKLYRGFTYETAKDEKFQIALKAALTKAHKSDLFDSWYKEEDVVGVRQNVDASS